jgi:predicted RNase H-like HicB family nuclease
MGEIMKCKIILQQTDEGFSVHCPEFPGCWSQGDTIEEARENIIDAVREYLAARRDQEGDTTP